MLREKSRIQNCICNIIQGKTPKYYQQFLLRDDYGWILLSSFSFSTSCKFARINMLLLLLLLGKEEQTSGKYMNGVGRTSPGPIWRKIIWFIPAELNAFILNWSALSQISWLKVTPIQGQREAQQVSGENRILNLKADTASSASLVWSSFTLTIITLCLCWSRVYLRTWSVLA